MDKDTISQQPYLTFFSDETAEYDVIVDQSSSAPNLKEATWGAIQPLLPIIGEGMGPDEMALVLEYSPMPESFLEKFKAIQEQKAQQPPPPDPEMMKIEAMKQAKAAELEFKQQEAAIDMQTEQQKAAAQIQLEREKAGAQIQLEREKAQADIMIQRERADADMKLKATTAHQDMKIKATSARADIQGRAMKQASEAESDADGAEMPDPEDMDLFGNRALAESLAQMAQAMTEMAKANAESQRMMAEGIASLGSELSQAMTKPKQIVRGADGRAIGVQ
jgi:hypothetical protein